MDLQRLKQRAAARIDEAGARLDDLALAIHDHPELGYEERFACRALTDFLARESLPVTVGAAP